MSLPPKIIKLSDYKIGKKKDIIKLLLGKDMTHICFNILSRLDSRSFTNCRLVSHKWKDFIDYQFYVVPKGKRWIENKLTSNYFDTNFMPTEEKIKIQDRVLAFTADDSSICVFTKGADSFDICSYDIHTFKRNWSFYDLHYKYKQFQFQFKFKFKWTEQLKNDIKELNTYEDFRLVLFKNRLYIYTQSVVANIYVIVNGYLHTKFGNIFPNAEATICDVIDFENSILATCCFAGQLIFFDAKDNQNESKILYQEDIGSDPILKSDKY